MAKRKRKKPAPAPAPDLQQRRIAWLLRLDGSTMHRSSDELINRLCKRWGIDPAQLAIT